MIQNENKGKEGKKGGTRINSRPTTICHGGTARRFFMMYSVYALIQLDERKKKIVQTAFRHRQLLLSPSSPPFSTPFVNFPASLTHAPPVIFARVGTTRKLVIKPSFNLSLLVYNCQQGESKKSAPGNNNANWSKHNEARERDLTVINKW